MLGYAAISAVAAPEPLAGDQLPGTAPLGIEGDIASRLVDGVDRFLLRELERSVEHRARHWRRDLSSAEAYSRSVAPARERLARILGVRDERVPFDAPELVATTDQEARIAATDDFDVLAIRWPAFREVHGEGLLLEPRGRTPRACVVAIPDATQSPEGLVGIVDGIAPVSQHARRLAASGCRVVVPMVIGRERDPSRLDGRWRRTRLTDREFLYRSAFELGRHLIGYEVLKVLAIVDWFEKDASELPVGVIGWGDGGHLALYAAALDPRIDAACVSAAFDDRLSIWQEPIDRNVFGLLDVFGSAELASLVAPRALVVEAALGPELELSGEGGAPARLVTPTIGVVRAEVERARALVAGLAAARPIVLVESDAGRGPPASAEALGAFLAALEPTLALGAPGSVPQAEISSDAMRARLARQVRAIDDHNQHLLRESAYVRREFFGKLDTSSLERFNETVEPYREEFRDEVIGAVRYERLPARPRTRRTYDTETWAGYEVVLDVHPDVIAYGILLVPKDLQGGEKRPVVVCQHGLEGRPQDVVAGDHRAYHDFAARLAERGFITFAPQNLYIFGDRFRTLQRKANPLKLTLFSIMTAQHQQIVDWLKALPGVDPERIAFYGLSYGGKTAMRVPALVTDYCLSICSADFNEWVWKNASTRTPYSYVWTGEYEIFEFDLGSTFNYAEMAALICPRPFMVERGHFDGVAPDEAVAWEFAKVRHLYQAKLGIGERCEIEWFVGPHTIHGAGTFAFLERHLEWPAKARGESE